MAYGPITVGTKRAMPQIKNGATMPKIQWGHMHTMLGLNCRSRSKDTRHGAIKHPMIKFHIVKKMPKMSMTATTPEPVHMFQCSNVRSEVGSSSQSLVVEFP
eukprot:CAMPEP_0172602638 /NCGR_PEP_ID=MMETSP1068-20121228/22816_1 /TAXON_ID=35684 /ORGANISM="Pseudopedinella elastica, Strain CCMP716" /LENGTH=101 /DNA_ID=CAMNT_0013404063 /DNA_START=387 /DNA_END=688 /DNA_ORIENTATION=+